MTVIWHVSTASKRTEIVNSVKEDIQVETVWLFYKNVDIYDSVSVSEA